MTLFVEIFADVKTHMTLCFFISVYLHTIGFNSSFSQYVCMGGCLISYNRLFLRGILWTSIDFFPVKYNRHKIDSINIIQNVKKFQNAVFVNLLR